ncbi:hypothetical protein GAU_2984 [Gemmatimonas aurantiaca T-27]|uniref:Uncharacterized protein n=1 Tax=Gemmatimonas aurantiaca (strain DSM 14586 / JCM 11422 / NBRC 100505 / T-27) TaxID=379066 RepID=C1ABZ9_GEMAT|nr:hypothetical protein GAU_2984 [Gemmatimonas aurantiaca T-27]
MAAPMVLLRSSSTDAETEARASIRPPLPPSGANPSGGFHEREDAVRYLAAKNATSETRSNRLPILRRRVVHPVRSHTGLDRGDRRAGPQPGESAPAASHPAQGGPRGARVVGAAA